MNAPAAHADRAEYCAIQKYVRPPFVRHQSGARTPAATSAQKMQPVPCFQLTTARGSTASPVKETSYWPEIHGSLMRAPVASATTGLFSASLNDVQLPTAEFQFCVKASAVHTV